MSVHSTSPIMSQSDVQVIPMEEQQDRRRQSWGPREVKPGEITGPFRSGYDLEGEGRVNPMLISKLSKLEAIWRC